MAEHLLVRGSTAPLEFTCRKCGTPMARAQGASFTGTKPTFRMTCPSCGLGLRLFSADPAPMLEIWTDEFPEGVPFSEYVEERMTEHLLTYQSSQSVKH